MQSSLASDMEKLSKKDHVFDLDAEPEPIDDLPLPNDGGDIIDDGFGPMEADDDDDDEARDFGTISKLNQINFWYLI